MLVSHGENPLAKYLSSANISMRAFARACGLSDVTILQICRGAKPRLSTVRKLSRGSGGKLTIKDFGYK